MRLCKTCLLTCVLALSSSSLFAGSLFPGGSPDPLAYTHGLTTWSGSTHFQGPFLAPTFTERLEGDIEWAVYAPGVFQTLGYTTFDSSNTPVVLPADEYVYAYQAFVTGAPPLSQVIITLENEANNIGTFTGTTNDGDFPVAMSLNALSAANWFFDGVPTGGTSVGLLFTSHNVPKLSDGRTIDDGSQAPVIPVPSPDSPNAPEPATLTLALFGLIGLGYELVRRRNRRMAR